MVISVHKRAHAHDLLLRQLVILEQEVGGHQTLALHQDLAPFTDLKLLIL